ncbi:uncharacterized protein STEHIDRAFT_110788 [Stereum hirsutum FP-91666 SS1]|uniref:uncharacterized protein n=1 Tax=Stereum hirsutum (strain FP-91666) TaxID=721885 RepID=UPI000440A328|nr:uncharacterized protein STEHIDRAFT_110788 [Stereum hirsutum FP-91666 SS1]EIM87615.1 hypothetical protein STEHIDRAFT_110788 [Stereum hirsutum FP-91666 SS1]
MSKAVGRSPVLARAVRLYEYDTSSAKTACSCMTCLITPDYNFASYFHLNSPLRSSSIQKRMSRRSHGVVEAVFALRAATYVYLRHRHNVSIVSSRTTEKAKQFIPYHGFHSFFSGILGDRIYALHALMTTRFQAFFVGCLSSPELETLPIGVPKTTGHHPVMRPSVYGSSKASGNASSGLDSLHKEKTNDLEFGYTKERPRHVSDLTDARTRLWNRTSTSLLNLRHEAARTGKLSRDSSSVHTRPSSLPRTRTRTSNRSQSSLSSSQSFCLPLQYPSNIYWYPHPSSSSVRLVSDAHRSGISIRSTNAISSTTSVPFVPFTGASAATNPRPDPPSRQSSQSRGLARRSQRSLSSIPEQEFKQDLSPALPPLNFGVSPPLPPSPVHYFSHGGAWNDNRQRLSHVGSPGMKPKQTSINFSGLPVDSSVPANTLSLVRESRIVTIQPSYPGGSPPSSHLSPRQGFNRSSSLASPQSSVTIPSTRRPLSQNTHGFTQDPTKRFSDFSGDPVVLSPSISYSHPAPHTGHVTFEAPVQTLGPIEAPLEHGMHSHRRNVAEHDSGSFWDESRGAHTFTGKSDDREESMDSMSQSPLANLLPTEVFGGAGRAVFCLGLHFLPQSFYSLVAVVATVLFAFLEESFATPPFSPFAFLSIEFGALSCILRLTYARATTPRSKVYGLLASAEPTERIIIIIDSSHLNLYHGTGFPQSRICTKQPSQSPTQVARCLADSDCNHLSMILRSYCMLNAVR